MFRAALLVVELRKRTGVEEIVWQSALLPKGNHGVGKRTRDGRQRLPDFLQADVITFRFRPFLRRKVSLYVLADSSRVGDCERDLLAFFKRYGLQRLENAVFVHRLKLFLHTPSV